MIEKYVLKMYEEIELELGRNVFHLPQPITYEFVHAKAQPILSNISYNDNDERIAELYTALELRQDKSVIKYRKSMSDLEQAIVKGNAPLEIIQAMDTVRDVTKQIKSKQIEDEQIISIHLEDEDHSKLLNHSNLHEYVKERLCK